MHLVNKTIKRFAAFLAFTLGLTLSLSLAMGHWMSEEPMHHGDHECCDFVPVQASNPPSTLLILLPCLAVVSLGFVLTKNEVVQTRTRLVPSIIQQQHRRYLKGVIQRE